MRNKLVDLNDILFAELERLNDDEAMKDEEAQKKEISRAAAINKTAQTIINNGQLMLAAMKTTDAIGVDSNDSDAATLLIGDKTD